MNCFFEDHDSSNVKLGLRLPSKGTERLRMTTNSVAAALLLANYGDGMTHSAVHISLHLLFLFVRLRAISLHTLTDCDRDR